MYRRRFLALLCGSAGLAGCVGRPDGQSTRGSGPETREPTGTASPTTVPEVSVRLWSAYRYSYQTDLVGVVGPERDQFAFVRPPESASAPPPEAFSLELGDRAFDPEPLEGKTWSWMPGMENGPGSVYFGGDEHRNPSKSGYLVFDVPTVDVDVGALVREGTRYPIPDDGLSAFATAPEFVVRSVEVPETVKPEGRVDLSVTVANEGDADGTFLGGFWKSAYPKPMNVDVAAGETGSATVGHDISRDDGTMEFAFVFARDRRDYEVEIRRSPTEVASDPGTTTTDGE